MHTYVTDTHTHMYAFQAHQSSSCWDLFCYNFSIASKRQRQPCLHSVTLIVLDWLYWWPQWWFQNRLHSALQVLLSNNFPSPLYHHSHLSLSLFAGQMSKQWLGEWLTMGNDIIRKIQGVPIHPRGVPAQAVMGTGWWGWGRLFILTQGILPGRCVIWLES